MEAGGLIPKVEPEEPSEAARSGHSEPVNFVDPDFEKRILELCSKFPKGISDEMISRDQPSLDKERMVKALQRLLSQGKIDILKSKGSALLYRLKVTASSSSMPKGFEREERLVYQLIESSGNQGIWRRHIARQANMTETVLNKTIRNLESKMLIKPMPVPGSKKKMYILYDVCPDEAVTGGAWYSEHEFESEFVEVLNQHCFKVLQQKAFKASSLTDPLSRGSASLCSTQEVCKFITELGISKVKLSVDNIRMILDTLVYDGRAEVHVMSGTQEEEKLQRHYRVAEPVLQDTGFSRIPCGICPVIDQCCDGGAVSPTTCVYMKEWLQF